MDPHAQMAPPAVQSNTHERAYVVWIGSGGCDGCTMSVLGAVSPTLAELLAGELTMRTAAPTHGTAATELRRPRSGMQVGMRGG